MNIVPLFFYFVNKINFYELMYKKGTVFLYQMTII